MAAENVLQPENPVPAQCGVDPQGRLGGRTTAVDIDKRPRNADREGFWRLAPLLLLLLLAI